MWSGLAPTRNHRTPLRRGQPPPRHVLIGGNDHADTGSCCFSTFEVRNSVLRLIPKMVVSSLTGSPCWYRRRSRLCWAASSFIGLVAARPRAIRASREAARRGTITARVLMVECGMINRLA
jgi:hypothetical protein